MAPTVNNFSLNTIYENIENIYSGSTLADPSVSASCNYMGNVPGLPISQLSTQVQQSFSSLKGIQYSVDGNDLDPEDFNRFMVNRGVFDHELGSPGNLYFVTYAGTWTARAWNNDTRTYKNGSNAGIPLNANQTRTFVNLVVGDRIESPRPISFYQDTTVGAVGAYGGYAGYTFATRNDREAVTNGNSIMAFPLDPEPTKATGAYQFPGLLVELDVNTTSNPTIVSTTSTATGTHFFRNGVYNQAMSITNSPTFFITANILMCAWRGRIDGSNSFDTVPMFPLTNEAKYGWFSQQGHIFCSAGSSQKIQGSIPSTSFQVRTGTGTGATAATETVFNTSVFPTNAFASIPAWAYIDPSRSGGAHFAGSPSKLTQSPGPAADGSGMIFSAESQADGSGTEMTPFISQKAFNKFTVAAGAVRTGNGFAAFITDFYNSSQTGAVSRYNLNCVFQEVLALGNVDDGYYSGNTSRTFTSCRFGDNVAAGDIFEFHNCTGGGWYDPGTSQQDETVFVMADEVTGVGFPTIQSISVSGDNSSTTGGGAEESDAQCNATHTGIGLIYNKAGFITPQIGNIVFSDVACTQPFTTTFTGNFTTGLQWFYHAANRSNFAFRMGQGFITTGTLGTYQSTGIIINVVVCSDKRYKKNIEKIGVSPSGINYYKFEYKNSHYGKGEFTGAMAQENLHAVNGKKPMMLSYHLLEDVEHQEWNGEDCNCKQDICYNCNPCILS